MFADTSPPGHSRRTLRTARVTGTSGSVVSCCDSLDGRARHVHEAATPLAGDARCYRVGDEMLGNLAASSTFRHRPYHSITRQDIQRYARQIFDLNNCSTLYYYAAEKQ